MNIKDGEFTVKFTFDEGYNIACHLFYSLKDAIKRHWNVFQGDYDKSYKQSLFKKSEEKMIRMMNELLEITGYSHCINDWEYEMMSLFTEKEAIK